MNKKTLVLGASPHPYRYSYKVFKRLNDLGFEAVPLGNSNRQLFGTPILTGFPELENIHTVTMYLNPSKQKQYYDYLLSLKPVRIIFNPGAENAEFKAMAKNNGIEVVDACTLVMLTQRAY